MPRVKVSTEGSGAEGIFDAMRMGGHEQVAYCRDPDSGLRAIIAIWSTALGPALGGCRFYPYTSEEAALADVLLLSRAMAYKCAAAGLDLGGGKAVIIGDPRLDRSEALLRAFGRFVDSLGGRYLTAEDVGTTQADMDTILHETPYVTGISLHRGGSGDPSPLTALGVLEAMHAAAEARWGSASLDGRHIAIQGVGKVGAALALLLHDEGARLTVADANPAAAERCVEAFDAADEEPAKIHAVECDVFAPCALGGSINSETAPELRTTVVCGSANNQLFDDAIAADLSTAGVLYIPDFVANAGGVINIADELEGYDPARAEVRVRGIRQTTTSILETADDDGVTPLAAARQFAEDRIASISRLSHIRAGRLQLRGRR